MRGKGVIDVEMSNKYLMVTKLATLTTKLCKLKEEN